MAENRNEDWKKDPKLEDIDAAKLDMLQKLAEKGSGKSASDIPAATITNPTNYYNSKVLEKLGLKVPTTVAMEDVAN